MKRHNFGGLRASHGVLSLTVRTVQQVSVKTLARCSKARRWLVIMGAVRVTTQNLEVVSVDDEQGMILIMARFLAQRMAGFVV